MWRLAIPALSNTPDSRSNKGLPAAERLARDAFASDCSMTWGEPRLRARVRLEGRIVPCVRACAAALVAPVVTEQRDDDAYANYACRKLAAGAVVKREAVRDRAGTKRRSRRRLTASVHRRRRSRRSIRPGRWRSCRVSSLAIVYREAGADVAGRYRRTAASSRRRRSAGGRCRTRAVCSMLRFRRALPAINSSI